LLFIQYAAPTGTFDDHTLSAVREAEEGETSFNWPKIGWIFVFQYPIIEILCVGIQEATEATGKILYIPYETHALDQPPLTNSRHLLSQFLEPEIRSPLGGDY
jgi:hypothetical protein